jgi:hypothetical protein
MTPLLTGSLWGVVALAAGAAHAAWLWRAAQVREAPSAATLLRVPLVAGTFIAAAAAGALLPAVGGWAAGLGGTAFYLAYWSGR